MFKAVSRNLTAEAAKLRANCCQVRTHEAPQILKPCRIYRDVTAHLKAFAADREHIECGDVIGASPITQRPVSARVVRNHAADRATRVRRRVWPVSQANRRGRSLQLRVNDTRFNLGSCRCLIDRKDLVEVLGKVENDSSSDCVSGNRRASAPRRQRGLRLGTSRNDSLDFVDVAWPDDDFRNDSV